MHSFLHSDIFLIVIIAIDIIMLILYIIGNIKLKRLRKNYSDFMTKLGKGENIYDMLQKYIDQMESINIENKEIEKYCSKLENKANNCIQKIGLIRYNAYKDTGSDLSFALAILSAENNGVVLNGIYARDSSNIYCKTIENGNSSYALSKEEKEAIDKAIKIII